MSFRVVRSSKFRHVFGQAQKRDHSYDGIRITKSSWDSPFCSVNPKYVAVISESAGGGAFYVIPLSKTGRLERDFPLVAGHKGAVLDIAWCPFNDDVIASGSEDCTVKVWQIPSNWPHRGNLDESVVDLVAHQRRVGLVLWHPTANNVLLSAGADCKIFIWNVGIGESLIEINCHPDLIFSASFNYNGSRLVTTCKDKLIRIIDPRSGSVLEQGKGHDGAKPQKAVYLKEGTIFTTGFSRMSERQYALWKGDNLDEALMLEDLDNSNGVMWPFYDPDTSMVYLCGKGDSNIRYFEVTNEYPYVHYLNMYQSGEPQRGIGFMPKRGCDVNTNEIARFYKLHTKGFCEIITMTVPRKSELFQNDLYPDTAGDVPSLTADDWFSGKNADPILISLKAGYKPSSTAAVLTVTRKTNILDQMPKKDVNGGKVASENVEELQRELKLLKQLTKAHEETITALKDKIDRQDEVINSNRNTIQDLEDRIETLEKLDNVEV